MDGLKVDSIFIKETGQGFMNTPLVYITEPDRGVQATAVAIMTSRTANTGLGIDRILLIDPGTGYQSPPTVTISGGSGGGIATAVINTGVMGPVASSLVVLDTRLHQIYTFNQSSFLHRLEHPLQLIMSVQSSSGCYRISYTN